MGELITHRDISDDLADLSLTQARMIAALDDMPALPPGPPRVAVVVDATSSMGKSRLTGKPYLPARRITIEAAKNFLRPCA